MSDKQQNNQCIEPLEVFGCIGEYVDFYARIRANSEAVVFAENRMSYRQLKENIDKCAKAMLAFGVRKGDRVAVLCTPRTEYWVLFLAATRIGAIWVGLNPKFKLDETRYIVSDCQPKLLFSLSQFEGRKYGGDVAALQQENPRITNAIAIEGEINTALAFPDFLKQAKKISSEQYQASINIVDTSDPALIVYTSGTTGQPKGAVLSHHGLTCGATMQTRHFDIDCPVVVVNFPINHVACVADTCATTLVKGGKIIFQERFDVTASLQAIEDEQCTMLGGIPTMLQMQLDHPGFKDFDLTSLELVVWGGAAMPREGITRLQKVAPRLIQLYGMTETAANIVFGDEGASIDELAGSIGKPDAGVECRIIDDSGDLCPPGKSGELQFKADYFFLEYWNRPDATRATFTADGWLKTGDIGLWRADGNIELVGRKSEMFKSGGDNVYPREIEIVLESIPEVAMAAVIGVSDDLYSEVGFAFILPEQGQTISADELRVACKKMLANYKVPKQFDIRPDLPMLPVGKIDKQALKKMAIASREMGRETATEG